MKNFTKCRDCAYSKNESRVFEDGCDYSYLGPTFRPDRKYIQRVCCLFPKHEDVADIHGCFQGERKV